MERTWRDARGSGTVGALVFTPVDGVHVSASVHFIAADGPRFVAESVGHTVKPFVHLGRGHFVVVREAVARDLLRNVEAAASVVEVSPEEHEEVAKLERPTCDEV